ncbi:molybdopterin molybdotransferase MoeA [Microbacterium pygmaeum]|uniref:Molybdopterin molybdenumtransferase n=1 Tax=Microbacterium pygmaeum TaxID=370764 RepID=A0A1G7WJU7_9MICO|nr:gephyrin-like molybdotransferase Glp [Microbacterium pygmaeum]SDG72287.1 molybdopterin molybdochelatase [Microbacterium pygmaeum]
MRPLLSVQDHLAAVLATVAPLDGETIPLDAASGRTLRESVSAAVAIPVFDNSAMDGFAVRFTDVARADRRQPIRLTVVADLPAGTNLDPRIPEGCAARIMTGSPVPTDADTVVPFEDTTGGLADSLETASVVVAPRTRGAHIRRAGEDVATGSLVVARGAVLGPLQVAAVAAAGVSGVVVGRRPRVAVISTGDELAEPGSALRPGQIPDSNGRLLSALVADAGCHVVMRTTISDQPAALEHLLDELARQAPSPRADVVVFSGGVSGGAYEVVKETLSGSMTFSDVAMQPGKPQAFGRLPDGTLAFGLPGNPVSAAVSFEVFVRPALLAMLGRSDLQRPVLALPTLRGWRSPEGKRQYVPVALDRSNPRSWHVVPATMSGSHRAGGIARAEAFAVIPPDVDVVRDGDVVDVMLIA